MGAQKRAVLAVLAAAITLTAGLSSVASTYHEPEPAPETEITIVRDQFGVPHVYGETAEDVSYGAGYALAEDRLWQMHVFRLIGKGELSELLGPLVLDIDRDIRFFTYTEEERQARFNAMPDHLQAMLEGFRDGINARIDELEKNPELVPFEFAEFGEWPTRPWTVTDSIGLQDVLILAFGAGGGRELRHAALLDELIEDHGKAEGLEIFDDLIRTVDNDGPVTVPRGYDYANESAATRIAEAEAKRGLNPDARLGLTPDQGDLLDVIPGPAADTTLPEQTRGTLEQLALIPDMDAAMEGFEELERMRAAFERVFTFGSNAQIVGPELSETGNALQTGGPQVGYLLPQWLADFGLHSEDGLLDATGMTFAGAGPAVLIGRGTGYAWTTTTGSSDLMDTYIEELNPTNPRQYLFDPDGAGPQPAQWETMECRTETYAFKGVPFDSEELCRTRHGPVVSVDEANDVAYSLRYAWFNRETQTVEGFFGYNHVESVEDFGTFANYLASNHNMFYTDDQGNYGFWHPGNFPLRAPGVDLRLPQDGTGTSEWQGLVPVQETPHAVNFERGWLANWNNMPAEDWPRERAYDPFDNANSLHRTIDPDQGAVADPDGGLVNPDRALDFQDLNGNLRYAAFQDHQLTAFGPLLPDAADLETDLAQEALAELEAWDGFLNDPDGDGLYHAGTTILDAWADRLPGAMFNDDLGDKAGWAGKELTWHVLSPASSLALSRDYLNGEDPGAFTARVFEAAVASLSSQYDNEDPSSWQEAVDMEHYQRLNADLFTDILIGEAGVDNGPDHGIPGDVRDHIDMDRGTYNHIVAYQTPPTGTGVLGEAVAKAGSVIPPGQSGYIDLTGQEDAHYEDQLELYEEWRYKPMPMTLDQARGLAESEVVLTR